MTEIARAMNLPLINLTDDAPSTGGHNVISTKAISEKSDAAFSNHAPAEKEIAKHFELLNAKIDHLQNQVQQLVDGSTRRSSVCTII